LIKFLIVAGSLVASGGAFAAVDGCCGSIECCLKFLVYCL